MTPSLFIPRVLDEDRGCVSPFIIQERDSVPHQRYSLLWAAKMETPSGNQRSKWRVRRGREIEREKHVFFWNPETAFAGFNYTVLITTVGWKEKEG